MNTIDRHLLREWLGILALVLTATVGLILIHAMYDEFQDLLKLEAGIADMIMYFAIKVPGLLALLLPVAIMISLLYALGQLHRSNEITVLRAAGLGILRITRSIWLFGLVLCGVMALLNTTVVPWSVETARETMEQLKFRFEEKKGTRADILGLSPVITFDNQRDGRIWFMNRYNRLTHRGYGVTVSELDANRKETRRLYAREATYDRASASWTFREGHEARLQHASGDWIPSAPFTQKHFPHFREDPDFMRIFDVKPADLSLYELRRIIDFFTIEENPKLTIYAVRYYGLIAETLAPLIVIALAIPFALSGVRVNPAVGVSKALGLFALYYILDKLSNAMGIRGTLDPLTAACLPSIVMLLLGGALFTRMR